MFKKAEWIVPIKKCRFLMFSRVVALLAFVFCGSAYAADITSVPLDKTGEGAIFITGEITLEDREHFLTKISPFSSGVVVLNSDGGNAYAGIEIGKAIRMRGFKTWVPSGSSCVSACGIVWLGGTTRLMGKTALIGFHSVYKIRGGAPVETGAGNAVYGAYLAQLGLSDRAIYYLSNAPPSSMNWLTPAQAENFGINLAVFDPKSTQSGAALPANPANSLETRARDFIIALNVTLSGSTEQYLKIVDGIYSDPVLYFGTPVSRVDIVDQLAKFVARWPVRSYVVQPGSLKVQCNEIASECHVKGLLDFDAKSTERKQWSHGVAAFDYLLSFRQGARWPLITTENGSVVSRKLEALQVVNPPRMRDFGSAQ